MATDASILLGYQQPKFTSPQELMQAKMAMDQNELANRMGTLKLQEYESGVAEKNALSNAYKQFGTDGAANVNKLYQGGFGKQAQELQKAQGEALKEAAQTKEFNLKNTNLALTQHRDMVNQIQTPADAKQWLLAGYQNPDTKHVFENLGSLEQAMQRFDQSVTTPEQFAQWKTAVALKADELVKYSKPDANAVLQAKTSRDNNAATVGATIRGQNLVDGRAKEANGKGQYDPERGLLIDPRTGQARQVVGTDGQPIAPKNGGLKLTEDQGKATGWLVQAENAYKNMMAVGVDKHGKPTSAATPGFNDGLAAIPSFGLTEAIANTMRGADRQKFIQATSSLSESLLRAATGAGVNRDEAEQKVKELTPQFGEDAETTKQKYAAIPLYIESLKVRAGPGAKLAAGVAGGNPAGVPDMSAIDAEIARRQKGGK